jgi:YHS domain-containing protein
MYKAIIALLFAGLIMTQSTAEAAQGLKLKKIDDPSYVCMVNNEVMGKPQIPVKVGNQTYYGCCKMCVGTLTNDRKARFAKDPVSGREVDKAKAFIGAKPNGEVLYFESEKTFQSFGLR